MKIRLFKNGALTTFEKIQSNANCFYEIRLRGPNGELIDKVRCDDFRNARAYLKSFNGIARNA